MLPVSNSTDKPCFSKARRGICIVTIVAVKLYIEIARIMHTQLAQTLFEVRSQQVIIDGFRSRVVIYKSDGLYGVLVHQSARTVRSLNYQKGDGSVLRTFAGNEMEIIDLVEFNVANCRFSQLLGSETKKTKPKLIDRLCVPYLRLVHG